MGARLRVGAVKHVTEAEGPGRRFALWVQGCALRCRGCCNPHLFDPQGGTERDVDELAREIESVRDQIEGVTFLGGEPFEQAEALGELATRVQALGLSVIVFTGHERKTLENKAYARTLLAHADVLVDGPFIASKPERERLWVGSTNQRFHYLSDRYSQAIERPLAGEPHERVEVELGADGTLRVNGWPALIRLRSKRI